MARPGGGTPHAARSAEARVVPEELRDGAVPLYAQREWADAFPWLVQGTTGRGEGDEAFDLRLFGSQPTDVALARWRWLREATGCGRAVHARQVHGVGLLVHDGGPPGLLIAEGYDAHATRTPGVLLTVSAADCVPISLVDPERRAIALLHGGWRGIAAGVLAAGATGLERLADSMPEDLWLHLGPAICGACYEVGPEVHRALGLEARAGPAPVDLRGVLAARAAALGFAPERISRSAFCTRCGQSEAARGFEPVPGPARFFSHRGGSPARQVGVLAIRPDA